MSLQKAAVRIIRQLEILIDAVQDVDYTRPSEMLNGSTLGQHVRHTLEFFICFRNGFHSGVINYDDRPHDRAMENNKQLALKTARDLRTFIEHLDHSKKIGLKVNYDNAEEAVAVETNSERELVYNIEHAVHHMAIIRIGAREVAPYLSFDGDFGVAASTLRYAMSNENHAS